MKHKKSKTTIKILLIISVIILNSCLSMLHREEPKLYIDQILLFDRNGKQIEAISPYIPFTVCVTTRLEGGSYRRALGKEITLTLTAEDDEIFYNGQDTLILNLTADKKGKAWMKDYIWVGRKNDTLRTIAEEFYKDYVLPVQGKESVTFHTNNTVIVTEGNKINCDEIIYEYHSNGKLKTKGYIGVVDGKKVPVGKYNCYDTLQHFTHRKNYLYPLHPQSREWQYIIAETEYYTNGNPKQTDIFPNYVYYDMDSSAIIPPIQRKYYNNKGKLIKIETYKQGQLIKTKKHCFSKKEKEIK